MIARHKRAFIFIALSLFLLTVIPTLVAAQNAVIDPLIQLFTFEEQLSTNIAKYLFIILLSLLIWSVLDSSGFVTNGGVRWAISIIVSFLGVSYLAPEEVWGLLVSYNALGMTLLFLFPLIILFFFTIRVTVVGGPYGLAAQYFIWVIYFIFLTYRFVLDVVVTKRLPTGSAGTWLLLGAMVVSLVMVFANRAIRKYLGEEFMKSEIEKAEAVETRAAALTKARAKALQEESGTLRP